MKRSIILMIILIAVFGLFAQPERQFGKPDVNLILEHYTQRLNLTKNQQAAIKPLIVEEMKLMEEFHSRDQRGKSEKMAEFQKENENIAEKI